MLDDNSLPFPGIYGIGVSRYSSGGKHSNLLLNVYFLNCPDKDSNEDLF